MKNFDVLRLMIEKPHKKDHSPNLMNYITLVCSSKLGKEKKPKSR